MGGRYLVKMHRIQKLDIKEYSSKQAATLSYSRQQLQPLAVRAEAKGATGAMAVPASCAAAHFVACDLPGKLLICVLVPTKPALEGLKTGISQLFPYSPSV